MSPTATAVARALRPVIVNWGLGADSTSWLLLFLDLLMDYRVGLITVDQLRQRAGLPADADTDHVIVIVAMTGTEWPETKDLGEEHVLPRLALAGVRLVQVARAGRLEEAGITWLDDSLHRPPTVLHTDGDYRLIDEMLTQATIPTTGGVRKCSIHAKGWAADPAIPVLIGEGVPYYQVMGFEASLAEQKRAKDDAAYNNDLRTGVYPLITLGWDRARCLEEIRQRTQTEIHFPKTQMEGDYRKSACPMCPYAISNKASRQIVLAGFAKHPNVAVGPLLMEHTALSANPLMGLRGKEGRLYDLLAVTPGLEHVLDAFETHLDGLEWSVFEVRRALKAKPHPDGGDDPTRGGFSARRLRRLTFHNAHGNPVTTGTRAQMADRLAEVADLDEDWHVDHSDPRHPRVWVTRRGDTFPTLERFYVALPAVVEEKEAKAFKTTWNTVMGQISADKHLYQLAADVPGLGDILADTDDLDALEWAVFEVRRAVKAKTIRKDGTARRDPTRAGASARRIQRVEFTHGPGPAATGTRAQMTARLKRVTTWGGDWRIDAEDGRVWATRPDDTFPNLGRFYAVLPADVPPREDASFKAVWVDVDMSLTFDELTGAGV